MDGLNGAFPETLRLVDQGRFDIGYYQQNQELWRKIREITGIRKVAWNGGEVIWHFQTDTIL